jgi:hypothetical protein
MRFTLHIAPQFDSSGTIGIRATVGGFIFQWDAPKDPATCGKRFRQRLFLTESHFLDYSKALSQAAVRRHPSQTRTRPLNS